MRVTCTPTGGSSMTGPEMSCTSAPRSQADLRQPVSHLATANGWSPRAPDRSPRAWGPPSPPPASPRAGCRAAAVAPRARRWRRARSSGPGGSTALPPVDPMSGPTTDTPRRSSSARFTCVCGWANISSFMAGASSTGAVAASSRLVSASSASPCAMRAISCAVAGATITTSACWPQRTWLSAASRSHSDTSTGRPVSASKVTGRTNSAAERVSTTSTRAPASVRCRAR